MTPAEALEDVRGYAKAGRIMMSGHADQEMRNAGATFADVQRALSNAQKCRPSKDSPDRWVITGPDLDEDDLTLVVVIESGVIVVTVW
jgi:hypothetical protein